MAEIEVLQPGLFSTIQDLGRFGFMGFGVPMSGAMDKYAATMANLLLQNSSDAALLEITLTGPKLKFPGSAEIVITGGDLSPLLNNNRITNNEVYSVKQGDILSFGGRRSGCRAYLGISGGFETEIILNSRSWFDGVTENYRLQKGMKLQLASNFKYGTHTFSKLKVESDYLEEEELISFPGPEFAQLPEQTQEELKNRDFTVGQNSNRMAVQPQELLKNKLDSIITGPVLPGTVQLTPSGNLIILMRDCQTTGGYPRVLQLSEKAINILAQKIPGDKIKLRLQEIK